MSEVKSDVLIHKDNLGQKPIFADKILYIESRTTCSRR